MEQKFSIGLNHRLTAFSQKFDINKDIMPIQDFFELFSNYIVISNILEEDFEGINKVATPPGTKGIDAIGIIVNNKLITEESDLDKIGENEKLHMNFCFIQSTTQKSFDFKKFQAYIDEVVNFLIDINKIKPFSAIFSKIFNEENDFLDRLKETPKIHIYFSSGCTNHSISVNEIENEKKKFSERNEFRSKFIVEGIYVLQENELNKKFDNIDKFFEVSLKFHKSRQLEEKKKVNFSLISSLKYGELRKLIETKDGNLREKLFVENPRSVLEKSSVNDEIKKTLSDTNYREYFIYLNNGITILCDRIRRHEAKEDVFYLTYPRIINGCQTTHMLFDFNENYPDSINDLDVFVKVIATEDVSLKKQIIFATNNQNSIDKDLQALNEFHAKLEEYFNGNEEFGLYYERLRGQHSKINPPYKKIDIENMAKVYLSVILKLPHEMKSNAIKKIENFQSKGQIFKGDDLKVYYYCAILFYYLNYFLTNNIIELQTQTMDMHLLMCCDLKLEKDGRKSTDQKIESLKNIEFTKDLFSKVNNLVNTQGYLFERRGFYSGPKTNELIKVFNDRKN